MEWSLAFTMVFFLTIADILIGLSVYYIQYPDSGQITPLEGEAAAGRCLGSECDSAAALMLKKMDRSVDPCVDFHEYACGSFNREQVIPPGQTQLTVFTLINDENQLVMHDIISGEVTEDQPRYLQNMKRYYRSCMDIAQIEKNGLAMFLNDHYSRDWPTLNPAWKSSAFDLNDVIARYAVVNIWPIFGVSGGHDYKNSSIRVMTLVDGKQGLPQDVSSLPRNDPRILTYQKTYVDIATALGAKVSTAEMDASKVVDLEIALSKIKPSKSERKDFNKIYNPEKMSKLATMYPLLNISRAIRTLFATRNITIPDDERIMNIYPAYMANLNSVLNRFPSRAIQNLFSFNFAFQRVHDMSIRMREIWLDFDKMEEMIDNLKESFHAIIEESSWMSPSTKEAAYKKLTAMKSKIGYPDTGFTIDDIETAYEHYNMLEDNYYSNSELATRLSYLDSLATLRKPVDRKEWGVAPHEVNAHYSPTDNEIVFPAATLQIPMFSQTFQDYLNYGGIGTVIGHEITHGFDINGSQFDSDGNFVNWWQKSDRDVFLEKSKCIQDQCSSFRMPEVNMTLNGMNMFDESIADNGGLKESFRAYKKLVSRKGENPVLPHLGLTQDQLFFLAFGQLWCEKTTRERLIYHLTSVAHPPGKFRIIGTLQNSEDFAKAYNCPIGSYMNPVKKCSVW